MTPSFLKKTFTALAIAALGWLCLRYLLPIAMPFLLAGLLALAAEPLVLCFHRRMKLPRAVAAGVGVTMTLVILILILMVLGALAVRQLQALVLVLPDLEGSAAEGLQSLQSWLLELAQKTPGSIRPMVENSVHGAFEDGSAVMNRVTAWLLGLASGIVTRLPDRALGIGTWLLASYMLSSKFPSIRAGLRERVPDSWNEKYFPMLARLKKSVFGWLTAQLKLISITFGVLAVGFFLLQVSHTLLWAVLISLVDALPILGTGTVLIPWSIVCFLQGDTVRAVGLLGVYAVVMLLRMTLEPKLVGKQLGLDPLVTLAAMYAGYRLWGVLGMLFAPLLAVTARQLFTAPKEM